MSKKLQQKLLNVSNDDPCINLKNKSNLMIDLLSFVDQKDLEKFLYSSQERLELKNTDFKTIRDQLNSFNDPEEFINYCLKEGFNLTKTLTNQLLKSFKTNKEKAINDIFKKSVTIAKIFKKFQLTAANIEREENIYPLYVTSGFINGNDLEQKPINAPLLLYEVSIEIKAGVVSIIKNSDYITVNEKLNFYLDYNYGIKINDEKWDKFNDLKEYEKILKKIVDINFDKSFIHFKNYTNQPLTFNNYVCLALVEPLGGIIKKDVEYILKRNDEPFAINDKLINYQNLEKEVLSDPSAFIEINRPLNLYQKFAIASGLKNNTLIYGPPGTGKSETIASLIANIIYEDKNVLMVSEKMAALEVLEKRLNHLSTISLFAFKPEHKDKFYDALNNINKALKNNLEDQSKKIKDNLKKIKEKYENILAYFKDISIVKNQLVNEYYINEFINLIPTISNFDITSSDHEWFNQLFDFWTDRISIINSYNAINNIYSLLKNYQPEVIETLAKHHFKASKQDINEFLIFFNQHNHESWILKNYVKSKKDYRKAPLIKSSLKNEIAIIKLFEDFIQSNVEELDFSNIEFILNKPSKIDNELIYQQLIVYFLVLNCFNKHHLNNQINIQDLIEQYQTTRCEIAKTNDSLITNQFLFQIKNKINKNPKLAQAVNSVISYVFNKKRPNINVLIKQHYETLRFLFPIWVLSPVQTCILSPCKKNIFDYGIFDEASQMFLERAFPLVYRCKTNIVAGDDKQLQPTSFFMKNLDDDMDEEISSVNQGTSLFEQANISMWAKYHLKNHYRSDASQLIAFSNKYIYDNQLEFDSKNIHLTNPIEVYNVPGIWKFNANQVEVDKILEIIQNKEFLNKSILIVTFNQRQEKVLINDLNNELANTEIFNKYLDGTLKVRSLENVQGDEADIVILSISFAKDTNKQLRNFFGPLSQNGGINRLNVAITRAKEKMIIVKSINASDIKTSDNINNQTFKYFLNYVDNCDLETMNTSNINEQTKEFINDVINNLQVSLNTDNILLKSNLVIGKDTLDVAIINKKSKIVSLGIILDNIENYENILTFNELINKQIFLQDLKYKIYRMNVFEWKLNRDSIIKKIKELIM